MDIRSLEKLKGIKGHYFLAIASFSLLLAACAAPERPADVLTPERMVQVLMEVHIAEEKVNRLGISADSAIVFVEAMKPLIYTKFGVADTTFERSLNYYIDRPKELQLIYSAVVDSLQLREQRATRNSQ